MRKTLDCAINLVRLSSIYRLSAVNRGGLLMIEIKKEELEIVKLSVRGLESQGISVMKTLVGSIKFGS